jgi:hypothetical protein
MDNGQYCESYIHPKDLIMTCHCIYQLSLQINLSGSLDDVIRIKLMRFAKKLIVTKVVKKSHAFYEIMLIAYHRDFPDLFRHFSSTQCVLHVPPNSSV